MNENRMYMDKMKEMNKNLIRMEKELSDMTQELQGNSPSLDLWQAILAMHTLSLIGIRQTEGY